MAVATQVTVQYKGHCNHEMIHKIYSEHEKELLDHEKDALKKLRTEIHRIIKGEKSLKVTIYLENMSPITISNDGDEHELVIQFNKNGDIDYQWVEKEKTFGQKTAEFCGNVASSIVNKIVDIFVDLIGESFKKAVGWFGGKASIAWK